MTALSFIKFTAYNYVNINVSSLTIGSNMSDGFASPVPILFCHALNAVLMTMYIAIGSNTKEHLVPRVNQKSTSFGLQDPHF
jgi:hypothetical protein